VCGSKNPKAFDKLRNALMMHYHLRDEAVGQIGEAKTQMLIANIVERLRAREHIPRQVLPPLRERRHRAAALP